MSKHKFLPGDMVRIVSSSVHIDYTPVKVLLGEVCEIKRAYSDGKTFQVWQPDKEDWWFFVSSDLEAVTHEEKNQQSEYGYGHNNQWRPIETAPRDGTKIIVASYDDEIKMACWGYNHWWDAQWGVLGFIPAYWIPVPKKPKREEV